MAETNNNEITNQEILDLIRTRGLSAEKIIDAIIDVNDIIGVGLVTLAETLYFYTLYHPQMRHAKTQEEVAAILKQSKNKHKFN